MKNFKKQLLVLPILLSILVSNPTILVDGIHGWTSPSNQTSLENLLPDYEFTYLTSEDSPIDQILSSGLAQGENGTLEFTVPPDSPILYYRYNMINEDEMQHPYVNFVDPNGNSSINPFNGCLYIENPVAGTWQMSWSFYQEEGFLYEIGTGPHFYTIDLISQYDVILQLVENTYQFFVGYTLPLTNHILSVLDSYFSDGGGYLFMRESDGMMVEKPIIKLYAQEDISLDLDIQFPGTATYMSPDAKSQNKSQAGEISWENIMVKKNLPSDLLYEWKPPARLNYLTVIRSGNDMSLINHSSLNLKNIHIFRFDNNRFHYGYEPKVEQLASSNISFKDSYVPGEFSEMLTEKLILEGTKEGLFDNESKEFFKNCHWVSKWMHHAKISGEICTVYHFSGEAYDKFSPMEITADPESLTRVMWVFSHNIPSAPEHIPFEPILGTQNTDVMNPTAGLIYHEYGVAEEFYMNENRNLSQFGFDFYDGFIVDPTDNYQGDSWSPIFSTFGSHTEAQAITNGISAVQGLISSPIGGVDGDEEFIIMTGDEDSYSDWDFEFPEGSMPPVAVGKYMGDGKLMAINDMHLINGHLDNLSFIQNSFSWLAGQSGISGDVNEDGNIDVLDVVLTINFILLFTVPTEYQFWAADLNTDLELNVLDVVLFVNLILDSSLLPDDCYLDPEIGPCDGACPRYFFNQETGECQMFTWGCCDGVVPFETLEACEEACE